MKANHGLVDLFGYKEFIDQLVINDDERNTIGNGGVLFFDLD